eukprot:CAMPEP_0115554492 /NCGR_PEP_ID=MMETSP0271-20121206/97321_1 /TAXON_ID=71861 /ORGANISM="Scrippsiella trochoidea, Strain CCMP3099" /LENGTH=467 /DNA_ID=CAMNT_0002988219 /DNA_START=219 /DNA_END=1625 /DNA_ORIENTATION=-
MIATAQVTVYGTTFNFFNYYYSLGSYLSAGRKDDVALIDWYWSLPSVSEGVVLGPGPNTKSYYSWYKTYDQLSQWGPRIQNGTFKRYNELGVTIQNDLVWPEVGTIGLGLSNTDHAFVRPFLGNALDKARNSNAECDGSSCWNMKWLRKVFRERLGTMDYVASTDMKWIITAVLHKVLLNIDLLDEEAKDFASWMSMFLLPQPFPKAWVDNFVAAWLLNETGLFQTKYSLMEKYKMAIKSKWQGSSYDLTLLASTMCDALALAGGLSVPTVLDFMIALLFMEESPAGPVRLEDLSGGGADLHNFMLETIRRYAPVAGVPGWTTDDKAITWQHQIPNLQMAMLDASIFPEPLVFQPGRPGLNYDDESLSMSWAEPSDFNDDASDVDSHSCPGKDLSVQMISAFIQELAQSGPWEVDSDQITLTFYGTSGWLLRRAGAISEEPDHPLPDEPVCTCLPMFCMFVYEADFR